jgi:hypothetical protein
MHVIVGGNPDCQTERRSFLISNTIRDKNECIFLSPHVIIHLIIPSSRCLFHSGRIMIKHFHPLALPTFRSTCKARFTVFACLAVNTMQTWCQIQGRKIVVCKAIELQSRDACSFYLTTIYIILASKSIVKFQSRAIRCQFPS